MEWNRTETSKGARVRLAIHSRGAAGEDLVLFHGGMGSWRHWARNIEPLATHFQVHALDLPGYGDSAAVPPKIDSQAYFDLVYELFVEAFPGDQPLRIAGFSFGAVVASTLVARLGARVKGFTLIGPSGFGLPKRPRKLKTTNYKLAGDDQSRFEEIMRENLLAVTLLHPESIDDNVLAMQEENVRLHKGMNSRKVSILDIVPGNLRDTVCPAQLIFGDSDNVAQEEIGDRVGRCRQAKPSIDVRILPNTGHWAMFENGAGVNQAMLDFHLTPKH